MSAAGSASVSSIPTAGIFKQPILLRLVAVFIAYLIAGKLGQATTNIRSSNLGPVWPAYGVALAAFLAYGYRVWPAIAVSAFVVALAGSAPPLAALGQSIGATTASLTGALLLRRTDFDPFMSRLRDALRLIVIGAFGSSIISSSVGVTSLLVTGIQPYSGLGSAWLIYWLGDATGALLVTPLLFTASALLDVRSPTRLAQLAVLIVCSTAACIVVFGDLPFFPIRLHVLAFAVMPFVMWGAINFDVGGATVIVFLIAALATVLTGFGSGPFAANTPFINAALLDALFIILAVTGLTLAAVMVERKRVEGERERVVGEQQALEARLRLAAIVEASDDAIISTNIQGTIVSWNSAATRIFGYSRDEAIGQPFDMLIPPELRDERDAIITRLNAGERFVHFETRRVTKAGTYVSVGVTISALRDAAGVTIGMARIDRDISEQKRAEQALSSISGRLIEAQEHERTRIARELHDDIGQRLSLVAIELAHASAEATTKLQYDVSRIAEDVQALSHALHSSRVELLGLAPAVKTFCAQFAVQHEAVVDFQASDLPVRLPSDVSLCLYRVLQEALQNAAKHSRANRFEVKLWQQRQAIHAVVKDQGVGFDVKRAKEGTGIGLLSMTERVKLVSGSLSIDSQPGRGTTIHAEVPFAADRLG